MVVSLHLEAECMRGAHPEVHSLQPHAPERKESGMWGGGGGWGAKSSSESNRFPFSAVLALGHMYVTAVAGRGRGGGGVAHYLKLLSVLSAPSFPVSVSA